MIVPPPPPPQQQSTNTTSISVSSSSSSDDDSSSTTSSSSSSSSSDDSTSNDNTKLKTSSTISSLSTNNSDGDIKQITKNNKNSNTTSNHKHKANENLLETFPEVFNENEDEGSDDDDDIQVKYSSEQLEELLNEQDDDDDYDGDYDFNSNGSPQRNKINNNEDDSIGTPRTRAIRATLYELGSQHTGTKIHTPTNQVRDQRSMTKTVPDTTTTSTLNYQERAISSSSSSVSSSSTSSSITTTNANTIDDTTDQNNKAEEQQHEHLHEYLHQQHQQDEIIQNQRSATTTSTSSNVHYSSSTSQSAFDKAMIDGSHIHSAYARSNDDDHHHPVVRTISSNLNPSDEMQQVMKEVLTVDNDNDDDAIETMILTNNVSLSKSNDENETQNDDYNNGIQFTTSHDGLKVEIDDGLAQQYEEDAFLATATSSTGSSHVDPSFVTSPQVDDLNAFTSTTRIEGNEVETVNMNEEKRMTILTKPDSPARQFSNTATTSMVTVPVSPTTIRPKADDTKLPDILSTVRDKIELMRKTEMMKHHDDADDEQTRQNKESMKRSIQQSISAAVLVSLAHKRYERRKLAAIEIEKVVRNLVYARDLDRVTAMLLLLSDDYVRSTNEDARKGGVVAMAACAIGLKKAHEIKEATLKVNQCKDLILASVIHACQDHSQRVRYYATESLFNVIKVLPTLAVEHFFVLFEILRSLWADVDVDVRSGAELFDKKLKEIIIGSINTGQFNADACIPLFARFVHMRNKPTKRLTLTWLQQFSEKLVGAPLLEFLHLFLYDVFVMVSDPNSLIRQSALQFLNSMLPKLLMKNEDFMFENSGTHNKVDFDKILQSLVTTLEHPDPMTRKVAMFWVSKIVQTYMDEDASDGLNSSANKKGSIKSNLSTAAVSVRNSLPHVLPGLLLSIGDTFDSKALSNSFLPEQSTHYLAEQTNLCLQSNVCNEGKAYIDHLDSFIVALRDELDTSSSSSKIRTAKERKPYRMDVKTDGTGIESTGWFRCNDDSDDEGYSEYVNIASRLCALEWVKILFEYVVPISMKDEVRISCLYYMICLLNIISNNIPHPIVCRGVYFSNG